MMPTNRPVIAQALGQTLIGVVLILLVWGALTLAYDLGQRRAAVPTITVRAITSVREQWLAAQLSAALADAIDARRYHLQQMRMYSELLDSATRSLARCR